MSEIVVNSKSYKLKQCEVTRYEDEFGHSYTIDGEPVASATTLLSMGAPVEIGLLEYYKRTDKETQEQVLQDASERGTNVHQAIEQLLKGKRVSSLDFTRNREKKSIAAFVDFFGKVKLTDAVTEQVVAYKSGDVTFAGTLDLICTINGKRILLDFKTSKVPSFKHSLQVQAYKAAIEQSTDEKIDDCYVLYVGSLHKGARPTFDENGIPNNGKGWQIKKSENTFKDFGLVYRMAILANDGKYPTPPKIEVYPQYWQILEEK